MLADFGLAKKLQDIATEIRKTMQLDEQPVEKSYTDSVVGTVEYMSPEILTKKGHTYLTDYWALGILLYELATGQPPFVNKNNRNLVQEDIKFEDIPLQDYFSKTFRSLLIGLTNKRPEKRLGSQSRGGIEAIKKHPFFKKIDWVALAKKEVPPPMRPYGYGPKADPYVMLVRNFDKKIIKSPVNIYPDED
jgi:serine/threonine protein kinase